MINDDPYRVMNHLVNLNRGKSQQWNSRLRKPTWMATIDSKLLPVNTTRSAVVPSLSA